MARLISLTIFLTLFLSAPATLIAQEYSTSVTLSDWGVQDANALRVGQFSVVRAPDTTFLIVQALYDTSLFRLPVLRKQENGCLTIADFSSPGINRLGGEYSVFQGGGSRASLAHGLEHEHGPFLRVEYERTAGGYAGMWMHLFNSSFPREARVFFNAIAYHGFRIRVRGHRGGENIIVKIADDYWNRREDAVIVGRLTDFLENGRLETGWQTAEIPLAKLPSNIVSSRLASIVFEALAEGSGGFDLGPLTACIAGSQPVPQTTASEQRTTPLEPAIWVWNTDEFLGNEASTADLVSFLRRQQIRHVFLALPYDPETSASGLMIDRRVMAPLVGKLKSAGVKVHALFGDKDLVLPEKRSFVLTTMNSIAEYQKLVAPDERFYGVHVDIEPHLLTGFNSVRQEWFLKEFIDVLETCATIARANDLVIGADLATWLDSMNELTHRPFLATRNGLTKPVYQHVLDLMDNVALMDYRTTAHGDDGIILLAQEELRYAEERGVDIFVGVETTPLYNEELISFRAVPARETPDEPGRYIAFIPDGKNATVRIFSHPEDRLPDGGKPGTVYFPVRRASLLTSSRLSFFGSGGLLEQVLQEAKPILSQWNSFAGFAFHHYGTYRPMVNQRR